MNKIFLHLVLLLSGASASAFRLTPMAVHFSPEGTKATQVLTLENSSADKVPVQIEATTREVSIDGTEKRNKVDSFVIYPEQVVLLPNEKRNVRVTWNSTEKISSEKAFRIIASQLPLEFHEQNAKAAKDGAALTFLVQYVASAYVTPSGATARIKVSKVTLSKPRILEIELVNEGNAHRVMRVKNLQIYSGEKMILEMDTVKDLESENILAGATRHFAVHLPKDVSAPNISAKLDLQDSAD